MSKISLLKENGVEIEESLELLGDLETYNEILNDFYQELPEKEKKMEEYYQQRDLENYSILVHGIKSEVKYLGFKKTADLLYQHELAGKKNDYDFINDDFVNLQKELNKIKNLIIEYQK